MGVQLGNELGFDRVSIEEFSMPFWDRGHLHISLTSPYKQDLYGSALGGAAPSKKEINAPIVYFRDIQELIAVKEGALTGKVAFVDGEPMVKSKLAQVMARQTKNAVLAGCMLSGAEQVR